MPKRRRCSTSSASSRPRWPSAVQRLTGILNPGLGRSRAGRLAGRAEQRNRRHQHAFRRRRRPRLGRGAADVRQRPGRLRRRPGRVPVRDRVDAGRRVPHPDAADAEVRAAVRVAVGRGRRARARRAAGRDPAAGRAGPAASRPIRPKCTVGNFTPARSMASRSCYRRIEPTSIFVHVRLIMTDGQRVHDPARGADQLRPVPVLRGAGQGAAQLPPDPFAVARADATTSGCGTPSSRGCRTRPARSTACSASARSTSTRARRRSRTSSRR